MQLTEKGNLKALLTTATCALLGGTVATETQAEEEHEWAFDTALMYYAETDRVTAVEGIVAGTKEFKDEHFLNLKFTFDSLTGASANGAVSQPTPQTYTRPSGKGSYNVSPGDTPLDDTFKDTRVQLNATWSQPINEDYIGSAGMHISKEYDYLSLGVNGNVGRYFNKKNTTVSLGLSYSFDTIEPEGGIPKPFAEMATARDDLPEDSSSAENQSVENRIGSDDDKTTIDMLFGVTQVINRRMIMQFNYSLSKVDGYMTDPFKIISVVNSNGESQRQLYENRPDERTKQSFYWQTKYHLSNSILDFSYRYMDDDWEIASHTFDLHYRLPLGEGYLQPHVRYYMQDAAEFYQPFLLEGTALPTYASADYRIGEMDGLTIGFKYGIPLKNNTEMSFRLEYFEQSPTNPGFEEVGVLADLELFEKVEAIIAQVSYSF